MTSEKPTHEENPDDVGEKPPNTSQATTQLMPPAPPSYQITCKTEKDWRDKVKFWAEIFGLVVLVVYAAYTVKIYCANQKAADAAHDTLIEIRQQKRPWVALDTSTG